MPAIDPPARNYFLNPTPEIENLSPVRREASRTLLVYSSSILFFLFFSVLLSSTGFLFRVPITPYHLFLSAASTFLFTWKRSIRFFRRTGYEFFLLLALLAISFLASLLFSRQFYDLSYDGQAYHQEAIFQLSKGWNPFYTQLSEGKANHLERWINHYSKAVWIYECVVYKFTDDIEASKLFHFWLVLSAFSITLSFFLRFRHFPVHVAFLLSLLVAFNSVSMYQSLSFYLDGQLMSLVIALMVTLAYIHTGEREGHFGNLFLIIPVLVNTKLTAGAYTAVFLLGFGLVLWVEKDLGILYRYLGWGISAFLFGFFLLGISPYITNTIYKGNPFYPVFGNDHSELYKEPNMAGNFLGKNSAMVLFQSIFSRSDNVRFRESRGELKLPFTFQKRELNAFTDTNAKQGGFGPLFGGAILLSLAVVLGGLGICFFQSRRLGGGENADLKGENQKKPMDHTNPPQMLPTGIYCLAILLFSCLINPTSSLARFVPQMWLFPIFACLLAFSLNKRWIHWIGALIMVTLLANNLLIGISYYSYNSHITSLYNLKLREIAEETKKNPVKLYFGHFRSSSALRFDKFGIRYQVIERREECRDAERILPNSILLKCQ